MIQTPNINSKLNFQVGSHTPSAGSSSINLQNNCYSINSESKNNVTHKQPKFSNSTISMIMKMVNKLTGDKAYENSPIINSKVKDLVYFCNKKMALNN